VRIWNLDQLATSILRGHHDFVFCTVFSPDGVLLATAGGRGLNGGDHEIKLWNAATGREEAALSGHTNTIHALAFSGRGEKLVSVALARSEGGKAVGDIRHWDVSARSQIAAAVLSSVPYAAAQHPDGSLVAVGCEDGSLRLLELPSLQERAAWEAHAAEVRSVSFSSDARQLASSSSRGDVKVWDVQSERELLSRQAHPSSACRAVTFSRDDDALVSVGTDGAGRVWSIASGNQLHELRAHRGALYAVSVSADGKRLATAGTDRTVRIWDFKTGDELLTLKDATSRVWSLDFSPDGRVLAAGLEDGSIRLWRAAADETVSTAISP
jgi:WD40 repeat protein